MPETTVFAGGLPLYEIVPMKRLHIGAVLEIEEASFTKPWTLGIFDAEVRNLSRVSSPFVLVTQDGTVAGFLVLWNIAGEMHVNNIAVSPGHRGKKLGEALMNFTEELAREKDCIVVTLEVRTTNTAAVALYKKLGFKKVGTRKNYYEETGEDALIMTKGLSPA